MSSLNSVFQGQIYSIISATLIILHKSTNIVIIMLYYYSLNNHNLDVCRGSMKNSVSLPNFSSRINKMPKQNIYILRQYSSVRSIFPNHLLLSILQVAHTRIYIEVNLSSSSN